MVCQQYEYIELEESKIYSFHIKIEIESITNHGKPVRYSFYKKY